MDNSVDDDLLLNTEPALSVDDNVGGKTVSKSRKRYCSKDNDTQWRSYACKDCDSVPFTSKPLLHYHRVQTHYPYNCQKCGMVLIGRRNFSQHVRKEHPGLPISKVCSDNARIETEKSCCVFVPLPSVVWPEV